MGEKCLCLTEISLRDCRPPAVGLTFLRWTEIWFFVYVTLAEPSAQLGSLLPGKNNIFHRFIGKIWNKAVGWYFQHGIYLSRTEERGERRETLSGV